MGRVTDGSCKVYTKDNPYVQPQKPQQVDNTAMYIQNGLQFATGILGQILNGTRNNDGTDRSDTDNTNQSENDAFAVDNATKGIERILQDNDCKTIEELSLALQLAENELANLPSEESLNSELATLEGNKTSLGSQKELLFNKVRSFKMDAELGTFRDEAARAEYESAKQQYDEVVRQLEAIEADIKTKKRKITKS